ncbi:MAG TPA: hypothetical protein VH393_07135 [Ktedonobacterales bacterium]|jgi:hypothetical protein
MSSSRLIRLGGLVALVGFVFVFIMETIYFFALPDDVAESVEASSSEFFVIELLYIIALLIAFLGFVALYARQAERVGVLGLIGFVMSFFGFVSFFALEWMRTFVLPVLAQVIPSLLDNPDPNAAPAFQAAQTIGFLLLFGGWLLFGVATLRAGVLPRGAAILLMAGAVLAAFWAVDPFGGIFELTGAGISWGYAAFAWMGYVVWSRRPVAAESSAPMTAGGPSLASR